MKLSGIFVLCSLIFTSNVYAFETETLKQGKNAFSFGIANG